MKPGNLFIQGAKSVGKTRDKDSIERTSGPSVCGFLFFAEKFQTPIGFQSPAFPNTAENPLIIHKVLSAEFSLSWKTQKTENCKAPLSKIIKYYLIEEARHLR